MFINEKTMHQYRPLCTYQETNIRNVLENTRASQEHQSSTKCGTKMPSADLAVPRVGHMHNMMLES